MQSPPWPRAAAAVGRRHPDQLRGRHCCLRAGDRSIPPRLAPPPPTCPAVAPPPIPPTGFTVEAAPPGYLGAVLVGRTVLYWWPDDGWQRGTVARLCPRGAFSHVVAYNRQTSALRGTADTLLDAYSYSSCWVLLSPALARSVARALRLSQLLPGSGGQRIFAKKVLLLPDSAAFLWPLDSRLDSRRTAGLHLPLNICGSSHEQR